MKRVISIRLSENRIEQLDYLAERIGLNREQFIDVLIGGEYQDISADYISLGEFLIPNVSDMKK